MNSASLPGLDLAYHVIGTGEPILLVHGALYADLYQPLLDTPELVSHFRVIDYRRVGYPGSSPADGPISIADQARHARMLLEHLGIRRAHVVGHSSGAMIALQLALDAPESVQSLVLIEPARPARADSPVEAEFGQNFVLPAIERFRAEDHAGAVDRFMTGVGGPEFRRKLDAELPAGCYDRAVASAGVFFGVELPSVREWAFSAVDADRIEQPVLIVLGGDTAGITGTFEERVQLLLEWLPNAETLTLPGATHLMPATSASQVSGALLSFFSRFPISEFESGVALQP